MSKNLAMTPFVCPTSPWEYPNMCPKSPPCVHNITGGPPCLAGHAYHAGHACLAGVEYTVTLVNT